MSLDKEVILAFFEDEDDFFFPKPSTPDASSNISHCAYQDTDKTWDHDLESFDEDQERNSSSKRSVEKKAKVIWTQDLHKRFLEAVGKLGIDNAVPKKILALMNVEGLTRNHVASHLQKYRILSKKIAEASYCDRTISKPSSLTNGASWSNFPSMMNQEQTIPSSYSRTHTISLPILDTSSSCFPVLEASSFTATFPSGVTHSRSSPNEGYCMQAMTDNTVKQRNLVDHDDTTDLGVENLENYSTSSLVHNHGGLLYDNGSSSTEVQIYDSFEMGSSGDMQDFRNSSFSKNPNDIKSYSIGSEFVEFGSVYGGNKNSSTENGIEKGDMVLSEVDIASLVSYIDDDDDASIFEHPNQDLDRQNIPNTASIYSNHYEELETINQNQTLGGDLPNFYPSFDMDEQFMEPIWNLEPTAGDMKLQGLA